MSSSDDSDFWGEGEDGHDYQAFDFGGEGEDDLSAFYSQSGEFGDEDDEEDMYGDFDMDEDYDEDAEGDDSDDGAPLSITDRLAKQLSALRGKGGEEDDHDLGKDSVQSLFSSFQATSKAAAAKASGPKQDKSQAIRKQLLQYQQQLKIRLFLQQPQGNFEQLPLDPTMFVKLSTLDMDDSGKLTLQDPDSDDEHLEEVTSVTNARNLAANTSISIGLTDNEDYSMLKKGAKVRKLDCLLDQPFIEQHSFQISSKLPPGTAPFDINAVSNADSVQQFYKHPLVKKMKLSQAITAQTLGDLIRLERAIAKGSGASVYDEGTSEKDANSSSNLSATALLDEAFQECIDGNMVLRGMTAKQTSDLIIASVKENKSVIEDLGDDNDELDDHDRANILLSNYQEHFDNIETYLDLLFTTSTSKISKTLDKWDKRTNSSLATSIVGSSDLSSLSIPISQQIITTVSTEQKRLIQKSRLRRFALNPLCIDPQVKQQLLLALSDLSENTIAAQERFDTDIYDDFDFTTNLLQEVNSSLHDYSAATSATDALSLSFKQLQHQQDAIAKQLKRTTFEAQHGVSRHLKKKHVQVNVAVPKAVNFTLPRLDIAWIRANGLELENHSELDADGVLKDSVDPLLGTTTTDAMFVDNLLLHLFGTQQQRVSKYVEQLQQQQQLQKQKDADKLQRSGHEDGDDDDDEEDAQYGDSDDEGMDMGSDANDDDDDDDGDDDDAAFGGSDMGSWFKKK